MTEAQEIFTRFWDNLISRPSGPMAFRFILQPLMAMAAAIRDGLKDARTGRSPYFWTVLFHPAERRERLREGFRSIFRIILLGVGMDALYQYRMFGRFYPLEMVVIVLTLAFVPYMLLRGPVTRIARRWIRKPAVSGS